MIVRINQFDIARADDFAGWGHSGLQGPLDYTWPASTHAFELVILEADEKNQPLPLPFRQAQVRRLIPELILALLAPEERIVLRLDGPMAEGELLPAFGQLTDAQGAGRFVVSEIQKLQAPAGETIGSIRLAPTAAHLPRLCADEALGLERQVRLRAFAVPEELVNPLLDTTAPDDERWIEILPRAGFMLGSTHGLESLQILSRQFTPDEAKARLTRRLLGEAATAGQG
jgi:hypothetical protein